MILIIAIIIRTSCIRLLIGNKSIVCVLKLGVDVIVKSFDEFMNTLY